MGLTGLSCSSDFVIFWVSKSVMHPCPDNNPNKKCQDGYTTDCPSYDHSCFVGMTSWWEWWWRCRRCWCGWTWRNRSIGEGTGRLRKIILRWWGQIWLGRRWWSCHRHSRPTHHEKPLTLSAACIADSAVPTAVAAIFTLSYCHFSSGWVECLPRVLPLIQKLISSDFVVKV